MNVQAQIARKSGQILTCDYGHIWPLNLHTTGYCLILDPVTRRYVWADNRATLEAINGKGF